MEVTIAGHAYPMEYTLSAQSEIAERFGGLEKLETMVNAENSAETMENVIFCVAALIKGAFVRKQKLTLLNGNKSTEDGYIPTADDISSVIFPKELPALMQAMFETINAGNHTTVEVEPAKKKENATESE